MSGYRASLCLAHFFINQSQRLFNLHPHGRYSDLFAFFCRTPPSLIVKYAFPAGFPQQKQTYIGYWRQHGLIFNILSGIDNCTTVRLQATLTLSVCLGMGLLLLDDQAKAAVILGQDPPWHSEAYLRWSFCLERTKIIVILSMPKSVMYMAKVLLPS